ncbi:hypothetical protein LUX39_16865 [Actinomadura madurae]|nr:hypothetical protein [Actinomadura madurae]MCQ0015191.1 hypothetical protein [Actinomadura madurae]
MAEVDAHELPGGGVQGEPLGRPAAALPLGRVGVDHHDGAALQQAAGDLGEGGAGQPDGEGDLPAAHRAVLAQDAQDALLVSASHQRMHSGRRRHAATLTAGNFSVNTPTERSCVSEPAPEPAMSRVQ